MTVFIMKTKQRKFQNIGYILNKAKTNKSYFKYSLLNSISLSIIELIGAYTLPILIVLFDSFSLQQGFIAISVFYLIKFIIQLLSSVFAKNEAIEKERLLGQLDIDFMKQSMSLEYKYLEDPQFLDLKEKCISSIHSEDGIASTLTNSFKLFKSLLFIVFYLISIFFIDVRIIFVVAIFFGFNLLIIQMSKKNELRFFEENIVINRRYGYYLEVLSEPVYIKDFKMFDIGMLLRNKFSTFISKMVLTYKKYSRNVFAIFSINEVFLLFENILIFFVSIQSYVKGTITLAELVFIVNITIYISMSLNEIVKLISKLNVDDELLEPVIQYLSIPVVTSTHIQNNSEKIVFNTLEFKNVSFKYPNTDCYVLKDVSFKVLKGEKICIFGLNGAGKSTLFKLVSRLYSINEGEILINGKSIYSIAENSYNDLIGTMFQDFQIFPFTIKENISFDYHTDHLMAKVQNDSDLKKLISKLENGVDTNFDSSVNEKGVYLSGGEKQRIALARLLYKQSQVMILDEPSSSLDVDGEKKFYELIYKYHKDKTILFVSHRIASSNYCDKVLELENGCVKYFLNLSEIKEIKDSGFAKMYQKQSERFN